MDCPENFQRLVERFRSLGLYANFRNWAEGNTVFVGWGPQTHGEIVGFSRAMYIGQRPNGGYYAFDHVETDEEYSEDEVVQYVEQRLTASDDAFQLESRRRASKNRYQKRT